MRQNKKIAVRLCLHFFIIAFFVAGCGFSDYYSDDLEGIWRSTGISSGLFCEEVLTISDLVEVERTEIEIDEDQNEIEKHVSVFTGQFDWTVSFDNVRDDRLSSNGTFELSSSSYEIIFTPEDETKEVIVRSYIVLNSGDSLDLVELQGNNGSGRRFARQ